MTESATLPRALIDRTLRLAIVEGAFFAVMVGLGEAYLVAAAVAHHASSLEIGLLVGLPLALGGAAATASVDLMRRARRRRTPIVLLVLAQATVFTLLATAEWQGRASAWMIIAAAALHQTCGQMSGVLWSSWYGDVVPVESRGAYFSRRAGVVHGVTFGAIIAGGFLLDGFGAGATRGFAILFFGAAGARMVSAVLLLVSPEPTAPARPRASPVPRLEPLTPAARRLLGLSGLLTFSVYLGSPFFTPYMLTVLQFDYRSFMAASAMQVAFKVLALRVFGRAVDAKSPALVYRFATVLVAVIPLPWLFIQGLPGVLAVQAFSGVAWAAHELGILGLLLGHAPTPSRPRLFALQSFVNGGGQLVGSAVGGLLFLSVGDGFTAVFALSLALRSVAAVAAPRLLADVDAGAPVSRRPFALRMLGFRPSGGVSHRPVDEGVEPSIAPSPGPDDDATIGKR